jgi:lipopolysaccharide transport system ATP-binding protein
MSNVAIRVEKLSKQFFIGRTIKSNKNFREALGDALISPIRKTFQLLTGQAAKARDQNEKIWALKDLNFDIEKGEVVGIIGRNGAGKSTLLKILSRITEPTLGYAEVMGRLGSLLEVGTGFHPELTGRENIYLNGAILGMRKFEIEKKFDEIIAFAEVEKFIDTAVKHYSSGMYLRLAFAVAAHLETEILLVDEVLAVGDGMFQKKCLGKMNDVSKEGRTIIFVSHSMDAIKRLCKKCIWLDNGQLREMGNAVTCISDYLLRDVKSTDKVVFDPPRQIQNGMQILIHSVQVSPDNMPITTKVPRRSAINVRIEWESYAPLYKPRIGFVLQTSDGTDVLTALDANSWSTGWIREGRRISSCTIPGEILNEGEYVIDLGADSPKGFDFTRGRTGAILKFEVEDDMTLWNKYYGDEGFRDSRWPGSVLLDIQWVQENFYDEEKIKHRQ